MDKADFIELLSKSESGEAMLEFFTNYDKELNGEAKKNKDKRNEANERIEALEKTMNEFLEKVNANSTDEVIEKVSSTEKTLEEKIKAYDEMLEAFNKSQEEIAIEKTEKQNALLEAEITKAISDKKISDPLGVLKDAMLKRATKGENGETLIGDKSVVDFAQDFIDSTPANFKPNVIEEHQPNTNNDDADARSIMGL